MVATQPVALVANKAFPASTIPELVAYAKKSPEPLNFTSPGPRGVGHLAGEMLKQRAGIAMTHINYNGSAPALTDLIAGRVPLMFDIWHSAKRHVDSGDLKLIAGAGAQRLGDAPDVATIAETYPGFDVIAFNALVAPAGVPVPVLDKLSGDIRTVINSKEFSDKVRHLGIFPLGNTPQELDTWMREQIARWAEIAKAANIKAD
jgi:tripartite-type tricarboxylate transporter receptor subunit TctC